MKKILLIGGLLGIVIIAFGLVGFVYAQSTNPPTPDNPGYPIDGALRRGYGMMGAAMGSRATFAGEGYHMNGLLHEYMFNSLSQAFGLTSEELQSRYDAGETPWQIAESLGLSAEKFNDLMIEARTAAINQALADGVIAPEQANWMLEHMNQMQTNITNFEYGPCHQNFSAQGGFSRGQGWRMNPQQVP
jgi:hypothetical protein